MGKLSDYMGLLGALGNQGFVVDVQRCVSVRNPKVACGACAEACVSGCIQREGRDLAVETDRCIGCGCCATACPTGAIALTNPSDDEVLDEMRAVADHNEGTVVVSCATMLERVGDRVDPDAVVKVACLGRLDEAALLAMAAEGVRDIVLVADECEACPHAKGLRTVASVVACAKSLLDAWQAPCAVKLAHKFPRRCAAQAGARYDLQRREFLLGMRGAAEGSARQAAQFVVEQKLGAGEEKPQFEHVTEDGTLPHGVSRRRYRLLEALRDLGQPQDMAVKGRLWHRVSIDEQRCTGCQMCAVFCPSGALAKHQEVDEEAMGACAKLFRAPGNPRAGSEAPKTPQKVLYKRHKGSSASSSLATGTLVELRFAPGLCLGCDSCQQLCPTGALRREEGVAAPDILRGYVQSIPLKDIFRDKGGPDAIRNSMSKLIDSPYLWG